MQSQTEAEGWREASLASDFASDSIACDLSGVIFALAFLYAIVLANFVRDHAASCTHCASHKRTLPAAKQTAYDGSPCRGTSDNLRRVVMTLVVCILLSLRFAMLLFGLGERTYGER